MKRRIFYGIILLSAVFLTIGADRKNDELKRLGIFISNFTEAGFYDFDLESGGDDSMIHFGDSETSHEELIRFGIVHNIINNPKTRIKNCPDKNCTYGKKILASKFIAESVRKYLDLSVKHASLQDLPGEPEQAHFDGKNYHFNPETFANDTILYADVQNVERNGKIITMSGEIYHKNNPSVRPAIFTATAQPHKFANKDTWSILSLKISWKE